MPRWLLLLLALAAVAPEAQPALHGRLLTPEGAPLAGVSVRAVSGRAAREVHTLTDANGRFVLDLPGAHLYGLGLGTEWLPLAAHEAGDAARIDVEIRLGDLAQADGFSATSSVPTLADLMTLYAEAERYHRTPVTSPDLERVEREMERTPLAPEAVHDSLGTIHRALYRAATAERAWSFLALRPREERPILRDAYAMFALDKVHVDSAQAALLFERVPASSPLWSFQGLLGPSVGTLIAHGARELGQWGPAGPSAGFHAYVRFLATEYPDPNVRQRALLRLFELDRLVGDEDAASAAYDRLARDFPDARETRTIRRTWDDTRAVRPGAALPSFSFRALPDTTARVASGDLAGTTFLLDFWGSWCLPCVREMPALHALYDRYRARGFEIVSVAVMDTPRSIAAFQARGFPMPWRHGLIPSGDRRAQREAEARFEFAAYPSAILVGPDGTILAEGAGARGDDLERALRLHFGE